MSESNRNELKRLLMRLLDGSLSPEETARLGRMLREDAESRATYHDLIETHALLRWEHGQLDELPMIDSLASTLPSPEFGSLFDVDATNSSSPAGQVRAGRHESDEGKGSPVLGFLGDCLRQGGAFLYKSNVFTLLVAVGVPGLVLAILVLALSWQAAPDAPVAILAATHNCKGHWDDQGRELPLYSGMRLFEGQKLVLNEGLIEIAFGDGARVVLEGPTHFEPCGPNAGFLRLGRLTANVPPEAREFTIGTPLALVVDLGTEFGVAVADDGTAETHVFKGEVALTAPAARRGGSASALERLRGGQAARISAAEPGRLPRVEMITPAAAEFTRSLPKAAPAIRFAHHGSRDPEAQGWSFVQGPVAEGREEDRVLMPANDDGTASWMMANRASEVLLQYWIAGDGGLGPEVLARARSKGWVLRARIKVDPVEDGLGSICHLRYHDASRRWILCPAIRPDGSQAVLLSGQSSLGKDVYYDIPNSQGRYIDYEVRYNPATEDADVFVNGELIATGYSNQEGTESPGVCFGLQERVSKARFALVEWWIVEE